MLSTTNGPMQSLDPSYLLGMAGGELTLRILGNGPHAETVRITATKCTIGSAPTCTVRLESREIKPVHCILLRGRDRTIARKWSESTLLNGHQFTDAVVVEGDVIKVEHIQIEIVRDERATANADWHPQAFKAIDDPPPPDSGSRPRKDAASAAEIQRLRRLLQHALGIRADQGAAVLPYQGCENLAAQTPGQPRSTHSAEAHDGRFTHQLTAQAFYHEEMSRDWARERDLLKSELARLREKLQRHGQHAAARQCPTPTTDPQVDLAAMKEQSAKLEAWQRQLDTRARELAGAEEQLAQQRDAWNAAQQRAERQHADAGTKIRCQAAELDERDQQLKQREAELNLRHAEIAQEREQLARERDQRASGEDDQLDQCQRALETIRNQRTCEQSEWADRERELQQQLDALTAERQKLCDQRNAWNVERQQLCDERDAWTAERQQLCDERDAWNAERQQLCNERDTWTAERQQLCDERDASHAERQQLCDERDAWTAERQQFCDQRDAWERERELLQQQQASEDELASERRTWAAREQELESRLAELEAARVQLEAEREFWMQQQTAEAAEAVLAAENEARDLAALEAREAACAQQAVELDEQRRQLQDEREQWDRDRLELQEEQERLQRETEALQQQLAEVTAQQDELTTQREVVASQRAELQAARAELEQESQDLEQQREELVATHDAQLAAQQQELATMREEVEQQREQLAAVRSELDHAHEALERQREALVLAEQAHTGTPQLAAGVASDQPPPTGGEEKLVLESAMSSSVRDDAGDGGCENITDEVSDALQESDSGDDPALSSLAEANDEAEWQAAEPGSYFAADHMPPPEYQSDAEGWSHEDEPSDVPAWLPADDTPAATDRTDESDAPDAESWWDADAAPQEQCPDVPELAGERPAEMPLESGTESFDEPPGLQFDASQPADTESSWMNASLIEDEPGVSEDETEMAAWQTEQRDALPEEPISDEFATPMSPEDLTFEPPPESAPVDTASILAQFGQALDRDSETELLDGDASATADTAEVADSPAAYSPKPVDAGDTDEDSIHEYMKNLLARVGGGAEMLSPLNDPGDNQETSEVESPVVPGPEEAAPTVELMKELPPKPERPAVATTNLEALREIANETARSAIAHHSKRQDEVRVISNLGITLVALLLSGIFYFWSAQVVSVWSALSLICFCGGVYLGVKTTMTIFRTLLDRRSAPDAVPTETDEDPAAADDDAAGTLTESREEEQFQTEPTV